MGGKFSLFDIQITAHPAQVVMVHAAGSTHNTRPPGYMFIFFNKVNLNLPRR